MKSRVPCWEKISALIWCLLSIVLVTVAGCPDPLYRLQFEERGKRKDHAEFKVESGHISMNVIGWGSFSDNYKYELKLGFIIRNKLLDDSLIVYPDSVSVSYHGQQMKTTQRSTSFDSPRLKRGKSYFSVSFESPTLFDRMPRNEGDSFQDVRVVINLRGLLRFKQVSIPLDSLVAWERKAYRYSHLGNSSDSS